MKIFLSYAAEDRMVAEEIALALQGQGHKVFFDKASLSASEDFHSTIKDEILHADRFLFLISPDSLKHGKYALTELRLAREKWSHPKEHVVPVLLRDTNIEDVPAYLRSVTVFEPQGNVAAEIAALVNSSRPRRVTWIATAIIATLVLVLAGTIAYQYLPDYFNPTIPGSQQPDTGAVQPFAFRISVIGAERCIIEWRPEEPDMSEATLVSHGVDVAVVKSEILAFTGAILKRSSTNLSILPGEASEVMPGAAYRISSLGVNDPRYDSFHIYVRESEVTVSLYYHGNYIERIEPREIGIDWQEFQRAVGAALISLYRNRYEVEFGDVGIRTYDSGEWHFEIPYVLRDGVGGA